jgi:hypothetical protein
MAKISLELSSRLARHRAQANKPGVAAADAQLISNARRGLSFRSN